MCSVFFCQTSKKGNVIVFQVKPSIEGETSEAGFWHDSPMNLLFYLRKNIADFMLVCLFIFPFYVILTYANFHRRTRQKYAVSLYSGDKISNNWKKSLDVERFCNIVINTEFISPYFIIIRRFPCYYHHRNLSASPS